MKLRLYYNLVFNPAEQNDKTMGLVPHHDIAILVHRKPTLTHSYKHKAGCDIGMHSGLSPSGELRKEQEQSSAAGRWGQSVPYQLRERPIMTNTSALVHFCQYHFFNTRNQYRGTLCHASIFSLLFNESARTELTISFSSPDALSDVSLSYRSFSYCIYH